MDHVVRSNKEMNVNTNNTTPDGFWDLLCLQGRNLGEFPSGTTDKASVEPWTPVRPPA
ncbi:fatty acid synthase S-acetyltransferase [Aspergillus luchuensis]|uniref:Fatty acid synthase S-acetyltransferase n=1 Tax=Aspergillus kawachii TaxID=1069201 RepID=A0A146FKT8_ASPKA|nr:fatty acid synthase S-acetyltransferase [Aspergillus luchuensis]